jgi:peptidylprolyl isomerase
VNTFVGSTGFILALYAAQAAAQTTQPQQPSHPSMAEVIAASKPGDWRPLEDENTLYVDLPAGRVIIELAPAFAPRHVENVRTLAREGYYDGLFITRSQDNYVAQWGDPDGKREMKKGSRTLPAEFERDVPASPGELPFTKLPDGDVYAKEVGFSRGMPAARDPGTNKAWLVHCYAMVGAGRDNTADSGGGAELYVVTGHAPRHLDRNVTLLGRVVKGMELLSSLPRGPQPMGFYDNPADRTPLVRVQVASDVPAAQRTSLEVLRTDTPTFAALVESRRNRPEAWFLHKADRVEICNVPLPVRPRR